MNVNFSNEIVNLSDHRNFWWRNKFKLKVTDVSERLVAKLPKIIIPTNKYRVSKKSLYRITLL